MMARRDQATSDAPRVLSGIEAMRGVGARRAQGFWADAWSRVVRRPAAIASLGWIGTIAFFAVFAPLIANGHPIVIDRLGPDGAVVGRSWPLLAHLTATDLLLLLGALVGVPWMLLPLRTPRSTRLAMLVVGAAQAGFTVVLAAAIDAWCSSPDNTSEMRAMSRTDWFPWATAGGVAAVCAVVAAFLPTTERRWPRLLAGLVVAAATVLCLAERWNPPLVDFDSYAEREAAGEIRATYTLVPWSPEFGRTALNLVPPGTTLGAEIPRLADTTIGARRFVLGTDNVGRDVLSRMLHACRLSISIGLVSTGIAVLIGVTLGSIMGYFGGRIDLVLFRVVEIFMAIPVLFLLIVAAGVLPRNTYVTMAIIGCVTWTGAARFTRAEFLKLRSQDFVQSARAAGLPLRSVLFRHMLPNGVTPVLVDASFGIASAIIYEATLSFLGLGPEGQASWGQLLSSASGSTGLLVWWLATFPGLAIFLTVLAYNLLGEALRDAIDPKLRKAAL